MKKIFFTLFTIFALNSIYSQEITEINEEVNLYTKCFSNLNPIKIPDYPVFQSNLCSIWECLAMYEYLSLVKAPIDLSDYKKQIIERTNEIAVRLYLEGNPVYLTNGMDCSEYAKEKNSKKEENNGLTYICYAECLTSNSEKEFANIFNNRTTQLINSKNNKLAKK